MDSNGIVSFKINVDDAVGTVVIGGVTYYVFHVSE